ncbi:hypothetical protein G4B88_030938 [Cannabis sativa]|uniref:RNase H type-1 domain-containing protein n=1 Tax=Cannabis sativa TaxID=3483 RepID=A0A7J6DUG0_CANSA|nr:hypothetical protein G4B88_030938 [Cannabis sativa]
MFDQTLLLLYSSVISLKSTQTIFSIFSNIYSWVIISPPPLQIAISGIEAMIHNSPHHLTRPFISRYFLRSSLLLFVYLFSVCHAQYTDTLRAPAQPQHKKNPFDISNATPFEELFPPPASPAHSLQHAVDQFLRVHSPPRTTTIVTSTSAIPTSPSPQPFHPTIPTPIMTTSTISNTVKGKGIALPVSGPPLSRPPGIVINESSTRSSPTSSVGTRKHFTRQSTQVGDSVRKSVSHALLHCTGVKSIWHHSNFKKFFVDHYRLDIKDFYLLSLSFIPRNNLPLFLGIIWQIWNIRNAHLFQKPTPLTNVQDTVASFLQDYQDAQAHSSGSEQTTTHCPFVLDHIFAPSTTALFVDAALNTNTPATGIGMVFMQGLSRVQHSARIFKPGASSPLFAEAQALYEGLNWCVSSNLQPRFVFSDCINLISKVNGNWHDNSPLSSLVHRIRTFLSSFPEATLLHVPRQHNDKPHSLAKLALRPRDED